MRCLYVYNPISGKGKAEKKKNYIVKKLGERFGEVEVYATQKAGELKEKAREACGKYDVFVFAGGDGSFNEVVNGLAESENRPVLGYIPTGTVNDIARSVGIPSSVRGAVKIMLRGGAYPLDVMKINDNYAMYVCCCGGLTGCSYEASQSDKKRLGKIAYALEVLRNELGFDEFGVEFSADGVLEESDAVMVMIMNGRSIASMRVNYDGKLDDGKAEVIVVKEKPRDKETERHKHFRYFFSALKVFTRGFKRLDKSRKTFTYSGSEFSVKVPENIVWNLDGEKGPCGNINVKILNKHVNLIIPRPRKGCVMYLQDGCNSKETVV